MSHNNAMSHDEIISSWTPMVKFIAETYGENCEVILHDLRNLDSSIVAIANNHITNRQVGGTITDYALKIIQDKAWKNCDYISNYKGKVPDKSKNIRSSTFFIKDDTGEAIAMLCLNVDLTPLSIAQHIINNMLFFDKPDTQNTETFHNVSITDMLHELISEVLKSYPRSPALLIMDEKKEVVKKLDEKGVFLLKGAVAEVARRMETSEQTIYRYLK